MGLPSEDPALESFLIGSDWRLWLRFLLNKNRLKKRAMPAIAPIVHPIAMPAFASLLSPPGLDFGIALAVLEGSVARLLGMGVFVVLGGRVGVGVEELLAVMELLGVDVDAVVALHVVADRFGSWLSSMNHVLLFPLGPS